MENGIASVKTNAPTAEIVDETLKIKSWILKLNLNSFIKSHWLKRTNRN
jgi:hypothetical protein